VEIQTFPTRQFCGSRDIPLLCVLALITIFPALTMSLPNWAMPPR
jgi:hypothetical protein